MPALPRTLHLESRILGKRRLSFGDGRAAFFDDFILAVFSFRTFYAMKTR
jgi:hypothetical protein